jgi:hypothetical protein
MTLILIFLVMIIEQSIEAPYHLVLKKLSTHMILIKILHLAFHIVSLIPTLCAPIQTLN